MHATSQKMENNIVLEQKNLILRLFPMILSNIPSGKIGKTKNCLRARFGIVKIPIQGLQHWNNEHCFQILLAQFINMMRSPNTYPLFLSFSSSLRFDRSFRLQYLANSLRSWASMRYLVPSWSY